NNLLWIFRSWIITRDNNFVSILRSNLAHQWTLGAIAISTTSKQDNNFPLTERFFQCFENVLQGIRRMCKINYRSTALPFLNIESARWRIKFSEPFNCWLHT